MNGRSLIRSNKDAILLLKNRKVINDRKSNFIVCVLLSTILSKDSIENIMSFVFSSTYKLKHKYVLSIKYSITIFSGTFYNGFEGQAYLPEETWSFVTHRGFSPHFKCANCLICGNYVNWFIADDDGEEFYVYYPSFSSRHSIDFDFDDELNINRLLCMCDRSNI